MNRSRKLTLLCFWFCVTLPALVWVPRHEPGSYVYFYDYAWSSHGMIARSESQIRYFGYATLATIWTAILAVMLNGLGTQRARQRGDRTQA